MSLAPGTRLGSYEIVALIGVGGMGEVYRARDTKLGRDVAVKILPEVFASDPERLARFQREAQVLASLNHPNIAAIYGIEEQDSIRALILEFVEGDTIAELVSGSGLQAQGSGRTLRPDASLADVASGFSQTKDGLPLDDVLPIARQIADALEAAHEQGVVHRDLKPANIKRRPDGIVKVLDFGLAKLADPPGAAGAAALNTNSPTLSLAATRAGVILGTAAYMAPEQARGKSVDRRADNWAFGCVLYEMLTGQRPFGGEEISDTLAFILTKEPDWSALPAETPAAIRRLLRRCLEKDRTQRVQHIGDARLEIKEALTAPADIASVPPVSSAQERPGLKTGPYKWVAAAAALFLVTTVALGATMYLRRAPADTQVTRFFIAPPEGWSLTLETGRTGQPGSPASLAVSPDGDRIAFLANAATGRSRLWVRALDTLMPQELPGTDGASSPFWSPDSRSLAFFADGKLKKIDVSGGSPVTLCDVPDNRGGTWSQDGVIVFSPGVTSALQKVSASGGVPSAATVLRDGDSGHWRPSFLPDGRHFAYRAGNTGGIYVASLDSTERTLLIEDPDGSNVLYSQGHLLFLRETTLMAQPFDPDRLALTGEPVPVAEQIQTTLTPPYAYFSVSESGVLVYQTGTALAGSQLTWFDRAGKRLAALSDRSRYGDVELSPDGTRAAVTVAGSGSVTRDVWVVDLSRETRQRITIDPGNELAPIWSPDGSQVVFNSTRSGNADLYRKASAGVGAEEIVLQADGAQLSYSWSRDGRYLMYQSNATNANNSAAGGGADLWALPLFGDRKPFPFLQTQFNEVGGKFSPDGRWISFTSNESGRGEIYVAPFPKADSKVLISTSGGSSSRWRRDGKEIFYVDLDRRLMAAQVDGQGATFRVGDVRPLFAINSPNQRYPYDVSPDGQRFLVNALPEQQDTSTPITVVMNWTAGLRK